MSETVTPGSEDPIIVLGGGLAGVALAQALEKEIPRGFESSP